MLLKIAKHISLVLLGILFPIFLLEFGIRIEHVFSKNISILRHPIDFWDERLGWLGKEHALGDKDAKVDTLVIGDSFTEGLKLNADQLWFAYIPRPDDTKLIAYGGLGYGTLQELLLLKDYLLRVNPQNIILQLCSNDFINNSYSLEKESLLQRAPGPRPYFENTGIVLRIPRPFDFLWKYIVGYSHFANRYSRKWDERQAAQVKSGKMDSVEVEIQKYGWKFALFHDSFEVTRTLLKQFVQASLGKNLIFLLVDDLQPYSAAFETISKELKVPLIIPRRITDFPPESMHSDGTHFSVIGNKIVGEVLAQYIKNSNNLKSR
jgi:lysophospholipase L1-like esterase